MPPPKLATDTPVLNIFEPVQVNLGPTLRVKFNMAIADRDFGFLHFRVTQPPLPGEARLNRHISSLRITDIIFVRLFLHERPHFLKQQDRLLTTGKTLETSQSRTGQLVERAIRIEHVDRRQLVALTNLKIHLVVRWGDFKCSGTELQIDRGIRNDGDFFTIQRPPNLLAN